MRAHHYYVYILTNASRSSLYTGVTNALFHRVDQHTTAIQNGFSAQYRTMRLIYAEQYTRIENAIAREKQLKNWSRAKKIALIESTNPNWDDMRHHSDLKFGDAWIKGMPYKKK